MTRPPEAPPGAPGEGAGAGRRGPGFRIAGFRVRLTAGAYLLAMLVVLVGAFTLPRLAAGLPTFAYLAATAGLVAGFLISLAAHELAHAVLARRHGEDADEVRVGFFGGTHNRTEFPTPRGLGLVAAAGPLTNVVLTAVAAGAAVALGVLGAGILPVLVFGALASLNAMLAVVNALPAPGMDGGRVVHALAWKRSGDRARAAVTTAKVGQFTGALLVAGGVALLVLGYLDGLWAGLIGLVMVSTSRAQARQVLTITALAGLRVRDVLRDRAPVMVPGWQPLEEFVGGGLAEGPAAEASEALASGEAVFPVRDFNGRVAGLTTLAQLAAVPANRRAALRVADVATPLESLVTTTPDEALSGLMQRLSVRPTTPAAMFTAGHALVLGDDGTLLGVLTPADFNRASQLGALHTGPPGR